VYRRWPANLDQAFHALGVQTEAFTYPVARQGKAERHAHSRRTARLQQWWRIVWFTTVGTARARRFLRERPDAVAICHGTVLAGDIFVDHGSLLAAMRANHEPRRRYFLHRSPSSRTCAKRFVTAPRSTVSWSS
jgi:UDP-glucose:(heptosyl)LPS alpha-1,3-glucosyltransferase